MVDYQIRPATREHADYIAQNIRQDDALESLYMLGKQPAKAVVDSFEASEEPYTVLVEGRPAAMWGVVSLSLLDGLGAIWMLSTDDLRRVTFGRREFRTMMRNLRFVCRNYNRVENWVYDGNKVSLKLLQFLGFQIDDPRPAGLFNQPFRHFEMRFRHV